MPSLNERKDDIPTLANAFCEEVCAEYSMPVKAFTPDAMKALQSLPWTGNIRELRNMIERLIILCDKKITEEDVLKFANPGGPITANSLAGNHTSNGFDMEQFTSFQDFKDFSECEFIKYKLERNNWNVSKTADDLDIQRSHLYSKIEKFGLKRD